MKIALLTRVRRHFCCGIAKIDRHNQRAWIISVRFLGPRWLLAIPVEKLT
jgi:hypothetical protein